MTNFEKIKSMYIEEITIENIADEIRYLGCEDCPVKRYCYNKCPNMNCHNKIKTWLEGEVDDKWFSW